MANRHAWIDALLAVLGSETKSGSACLDWHSSRRAWIRDRESGSTLVKDRCAWIGVLLVELGSEFFSTPCSLLGLKFQKVWNRDE